MIGFVLGAPHGFKQSLSKDILSGRFIPDNLSNDFLSIEFLQTDAAINPGSFQGLLVSEGPVQSVTERLMYYSFITMFTVGFGDILPITPLSQKVAVLIGFMGQLYLVIVTAVVVGKFLNQKYQK